VTTTPFRPVVLRKGIVIDDPLGVVLGLLKAYRLDVSAFSRPTSFGEPDLRLANQDGARISAAEIAAILKRRRAIEWALKAIALDASLAGAADSVPWLPLGQLFGAFAGIRGVGVSKMTKALYRKRPALIPILDSIVQKYLEDDDLGSQAPFGERARARARLRARPGQQPGGGGSGPAGSRGARLPAHRGADPRPADLVRRGRCLIGWRPGAPAPSAGPGSALGVRWAMTGHLSFVIAVGPGDQAFYPASNERWKP
jgi:hypothetical protein